MQTTLLDDGAFHATFRDMQNVTDDPDAAVDIWPYVGSIPEGDLKGASFEVGAVELVYRSSDGQFDHVLVPTSRTNVYLVIVVSRPTRSIAGHHVLNLNEKYGLQVPER